MKLFPARSSAAGSAPSPEDPANGEERVKRSRDDRRRRAGHRGKVMRGSLNRVLRWELSSWKQGLQVLQVALRLIEELGRAELLEARPALVLAVEGDDPVILELFKVLH